MGATAEGRVAKRRINELEQKLLKLQKELRDLKSEKKKIGNLRKQVKRAASQETICTEIIEDELKKQIKEKEIEINKPIYRCKNEECIAAGGAYKNTGHCTIIETATPSGLRLIVICKDCGAKYTIDTK